MPLEILSFEERDLLTSKGWTRIRMHSSKRTDMWTHPVHSIRNPPTIVPSPERAETFVAYHDNYGNPVGVDFEAPGFVHLTREQALRLEGMNRADVVRKF